MKKRCVTLLSLALIVMLLFAAVPAAATSGETEFESVVVLCGYGEAAKEWYEETDEGTIYHFRNMIYQSYHYSEESRMAGIATWRGNQDLNMTTFTGRAWVTGVIETSEGTWHVVAKAAFENGVGGSDGIGHGRDGLESLKMHYIGTIITEAPPENPCSPNAPFLVMTFNGVIYDPKGD
jgi:hypothetical protein